MAWTVPMVAELCLKSRREREGSLATLRLTIRIATKRLPLLLDFFLQPAYTIGILLTMYNIYMI